MLRIHESRFRKAAILLVLCLLMSGLSTSAFAADFTDSNSIGGPYREAVAEMTARGVLAGFPDGAFHPEETLTREQGAKIVTYMILGDQVNTLHCDKAPFDDVAADRWSAPCIAWCVEREILLGYGDGWYGPLDTLTGDQFAKMLLCGLSLARGGNYVGLGSAWYSAVREDGKIAKLYEGDAGMMTDQPITREQATLLAWNAVKAAEAANQPAAPNVPDTPIVPTAPVVPAKPDVPATPTTPTAPTTPDVPTTPDIPQPGGDVETPEIDIDPTPTAPEPSVDEQPGDNNDDNGDILLPEVP